MIGTVPWGADNCPQCGFRFDALFWEEEYINTGGPDDDNDVDIPLPESLSLAMVYGDDQCLECIHCGTGKCEPLVSFLNAFYNLALDRSLPPPRPDICDDFKLSPYSPDFHEDVN